MAQSTLLQQTCQAAGQQLQETHEQICQLQNTNRDLMEYLEKLEFTYYRDQDKYEDELAQREHYLVDISQLEADLNSLDDELSFVSSQMESLQFSLPTTSEPNSQE